MGMALTHSLLSMRGSRRREENADLIAKNEAEYLAVLAEAQPFLQALDRLLAEGQATISGSVDVDWARRAASAIDEAAWRIGRLVQQTAYAQPNESARQAMRIQRGQEQEALLDAQGRALTFGAWLMVREMPDALAQVSAAEAQLWEEWRGSWVGPGKLARSALRRRG